MEIPKADVKIEMVSEPQFGVIHEKTKLAVLREAIDRADNLASVQAQLAASQAQVIAAQDIAIQDLKSQITDFKVRIRSLESEISELKIALSYT